MVQIIKTLEELQAELDSGKNKGKIIVLDFFATWCGPCARIEPKIKDWSTGDFKDSVVFLKCDVDESEAVATEYNIESMPTFVFFKEGKEIHRVVGGNVEKLKSAIESKTSGKDTGENEDKDKDESKDKDKDESKDKDKDEEKDKGEDKDKDKDEEKDKDGGKDK